jgi:hypothetical protein
VNEERRGSSYYKWNIFVVICHKMYGCEISRLCLWFYNESILIFFLKRLFLMHKSYTIPHTPFFIPHLLSNTPCTPSPNWGGQRWAPGLMPWSCWVQIIMKCIRLYNSVQIVQYVIHTQYTFYHWWSRNCPLFRSTWVHSRFLVGFVLLDL